MNEELTTEDIEQIFFAISVAEGEISEDGFVELKAKLYRLYPEVKAMHEQRERQLHDEQERQTQLRKEIVEEFLSYLKELPNREHKATVLEELIEWYIVNESVIRSHYSDEICFAFDLWKYADPKLVAKLADECRTELRKDPNSDIYHTERPDNEMVHGLIRILQNKMFEYKRTTRIIGSSDLRN